MWDCQRAAAEAPAHDPHRSILTARSSPLDPHGRRPRGGPFGPPLKPPPGGSPLRPRCAPGFAPSAAVPDAAGRRRRARADRCSVRKGRSAPPAGAAVRLARGRRGAGRLRPGAGEAARLGPKSVRLTASRAGASPQWPADDAPVRRRGRSSPPVPRPRPAGGALFLPRLVTSRSTMTLRPSVP